MNHYGDRKEIEVHVNVKFVGLSQTQKVGAPLKVHNHSFLCTLFPMKVLKFYSAEKYRKRVTLGFKGLP